MSTTASVKTVRFNVGGTVFEVAQSTINKFPDAFLARMVSQEWNQLMEGNGPDGQVGEKRKRAEEECALFIDRDPKLFELVLQVYRNGRVFVPIDTPRDLVAAELEYFCVDSGEGVLDTNWNLRDHMKSETSFAKTARTLMEEITTTSKSALEGATLKRTEAEAELDEALKKAKAKAQDASDAVKDTVVDVVGRAVAARILSKLDKANGFVKEVKLLHRELTTAWLSTHLGSQNELPKLMASLLSFRAKNVGFVETEDRFWKLKSVKSRYCGTIQVWDVCSQPLLAIVNRCLAPMAMRASAKEDSPCRNGYSDVGNGFTITLSALQDLP
mmetsp:Transcript_60325/g.142135  ORF Transcript_60325/g.142135 Transcript_60325/m.142135 type:complete len:329 (+) Transcript_60325:75-1061(+)